MPTFRQDTKIGGMVPMMKTDDINDQAITKDKIRDGNVTAEKLADGAVSTDKLPDGAIKTPKIADENITTSKLAEASVVTSKIADQNVTKEKIADQSVDNSKLSPSAVTYDKVKDKAIITEKLNDRAVTTEKVEEKAITNAKIGDSAVDGRVISEASVEKKHLANDSVATEKLQDSAITSDKIHTNAVTEEKIEDSAISNPKLADNSVGTSKIKDGNVTNEKVANNTLTIDKFDPELRKSIQAATGLPENLVEVIQDVDVEVKSLHSKDEDLQSQIADKQQQITANDKDIETLQNRSTQMEQSINNIAVTGGASVANTVAYSNTASGLVSINAQGAIDELAAKNATKEEVTAELEKKFDKESILQESGEAEDKVMSQKAVSDELSELQGSKIDKIKYVDNSIIDSAIKELYIGYSGDKLPLKLNINNEGLIHIVDSAGTWIFYYRDPKYNNIHLFSGLGSEQSNRAKTAYIVDFSKIDKRYENITILDAAYDISLSPSIHSYYNNDDNSSLENKVNNLSNTTNKLSNIITKVANSTSKVGYILPTTGYFAPNSSRKALIFDVEVGIYTLCTNDIIPLADPDNNKYRKCVSFYSGEPSMDTFLGNSIDNNNLCSFDLSSGNIQVKSESIRKIVLSAPVASNDYKLVKNGTFVPKKYAGKTFLLIGDSITEINQLASATYSSLKYTTWGEILQQKLGINIISRGVGGSKLTHQEGKIYYKDDGFPILNSMAGGSLNYITNIGMCDFERLSKTIPESIRNNIDGIILMGGTNDQGKWTAGDCTFKQSSDDSEWVNWSQDNFFTSGDFNRNTIKGALCSAIMKLTALCPNAIGNIYIATPLPYTSMDTENVTEEYKNSQNQTIRQLSETIKDAASYMSCQVIDMCSCGINGFNKKGILTDGTHPYSQQGCIMLADTIIRTI